MYRYLIVLAVSLISSQAMAYNGFNYIADVAQSQSDDVCSRADYACDGTDGYSYDVAQIDAYVANAGSYAAIAFDWFQDPNLADGAPSWVSRACYNLGVAWYYSGLPDWAQGYGQEDGFQDAYDAAVGVASWLQSSIYDSLGGC